MTAIKIATGIIDKLQEENRVCLDTLHKAQDTIKYSERQLAEKDRLIKMLKDRIRSGTDGILEMSNRQKELTIKHLELQIQKLLKENEELQIQLEAVNAEICPRCETKLLLRENSENRNASKLYKPPSKAGSGLFEKKTSQSLCPNRLKSLERIIEHKDKRIMNLSKEVQRLKKSEKELNQKVYRLTKLLPMSHLPPETLTEVLPKEVQSFESLKDNCENNCDKLEGLDDVYKLKKKPFTCRQSTSKVNVSKSSDRLLKSSSNLKTSSTSLPLSELQDISDTQINRAENEVLHKKLQKLYDDVNELKCLFAFESEKLSDGIQSAANEYSSCKIHLEEIINNLNDVVQSILGNSIKVINSSASDSAVQDSDDRYTISCLQQRLNESLGLVTEYEKENKELKEKVDQLKLQLAKQDICSLDCRNSRDKIYKSFTDLNQIQNINDVKKLKEIIKTKETQLQASESHIHSCQKFIEKLQQTVKLATYDSSKMHCASVFGCEEKASNTYEQENKVLRTKLDVAEKNIKTCENVIELLQASVRRLEEENMRIESELHMVKSKALSEISSSQHIGTHSKLGGSYSDTCINTMKSLNERVKSLGEDNLQLKTNMKSCEAKSTPLEVTEQEKTLLKSKLEASEKHICTLQKSVETLQEQLKAMEAEKDKLEVELKEIRVKNNLAETYENDVMSLKNDLILKEAENRELKESLRTLENKALEIYYYRKSLHDEIENLCKAPMESNVVTDGAHRKAIYRAAVLHSALALLRLDENFNLKLDESSGHTALDEMKHQIQVYMTEVARINDLLTIKEQERDELLKEYLDLDDYIMIQPTSTHQYEVHTQGEADEGNLQSSPDLPSSRALKSDFTLSKNSESVKTTCDKNVKFSSVKFDAELKELKEELVATKSVTSYLSSSCTRLEDLLSKERTERAKCERELEVCQETIEDLKSSMTKKLNTLIEMMRSKEWNDEITLEQLKSEIKWLVDENQKIFEKVTTTQSELSQCKEENCRIQNDLDSVKRQLLN